MKTNQKVKMLLKQSLNETDINEQYDVYKCSIFDYSTSDYHNIAINNTEKLKHKIKSIASLAQDRTFYEDSEEYLILFYAIKDFKI